MAVEARATPARTNGPGAASRTRAPAKVNLSLHVLGRRADGYHELESLVVFAGANDLLFFEPGAPLGLSVDGPLAAGAGPDGDNLILRAARALADERSGLRTGSFRLTKALPAAAGIGGGSSDAAAALRLLAAENGLSVDDPAVRRAAARTGADVPVCLTPSARTMRGAGEDVGPSLDLPPLFAVLVNPRVAVPTAAVFKRLELQPGEMRQGAGHPPIPSGAVGSAMLLDLLGQARNDLEPPALALQPVIGEALALLRDEGCRLARMSGSGATVFGLYDDCHAAACAARAIRTVRPGWWVKPTVLR